MERVTKFYSVAAVLFALCVIANLHSMLRHTNQAEEILHRSKRELEDDFMNEAMITHNELRKKHGSPPLTVDKKLCDGIEDWAKKQSEDSETAGKITMTHSHIDGIGENLGVCKCKAWTGEKISNAWYDEINLHNWTDNFYNFKTGHFTQLIWKETTTFCIARSTVGQYGSAVARYRPRGNMHYRSSFTANVLPPKNETTLDQ